MVSTPIRALTRLHRLCGQNVFKSSAFLAPGAPASAPALQAPAQAQPHLQIQPGISSLYKFVRQSNDATSLPFTHGKPFILSSRFPSHAFPIVDPAPSDHLKRRRKRLHRNALDAPPTPMASSLRCCGVRALRPSLWRLRSASNRRRRGTAAWAAPSPSLRRASGDV